RARRQPAQALQVVGVEGRGGGRRRGRRRGRRGQRVQRLPAVAAGFDVGDQGGRGLVRQGVLQVLVQCRGVGAGGRHGAGSSRASISSLNIFCTLLRAL